MNYNSTTTKHLLILITCLSPFLIGAQNNRAVDSLLNIINKDKKNTEAICWVAKEYSKFSPDSCKYWGEKALKIAKQNNNQNEISRSIQVVGYYFSTIGKLDSAFYYHHIADSMRDKVTDPNVNAGCFITLAYLELLNFDARKCNIYLQRAKVYLVQCKISQLTYKQQMQYNQYNCTMYDRLGDQNLALTYGMEAIKKSELTNDNRFIGLANATVGNIYHSLKDWRKSLGYQLKALALSKTVNDNINMQTHYLNAAKCYAQLNSFDTCRKYLDSSYAILLTLKNKIRMATIFKEYGKMYSFSKNVDSAISYFTKAIAIFNVLESKGYNGDCYYWMGDVNRETGNYSKAVDYFNLAIPILIENEQNSQLVDV
jgi:tetratricopeptide (TPR) repeat protein